MVRTWSIILGIGLIILGIAGLNTAAGGPWIAWLDILGGLMSFFVAASARPAVTAVSTQRYPNAGGVLFLSLGLFAMWIIGVVTKSVTPTLAWWNFGFACVYGLLAITAYRGPTAQIRREEERREGPRRVA